MVNSHFVLGVHLMLLVAWREPDPMTSDLAARSIHSNPVFLRRVLKQLAKAKLIVTQTGPNGGSRLARPAGEITLLDIYRAVEPDSLFALHTQEPNSKCPIGNRILQSLTPEIARAESALQESLAQQTLADQLKDLLSLPVE